MGTEIKRKLASVQQIVEIKPITGADLIEAARIQGWWVVVKVNEFKVGDLVCYLEIDSFVPNSIAPFLTKDGHTPKTYKGITGERLKTVKLRKQISQGLILPIPGANYSEGDDLTERLGIIKWEPEDNTCSTGDTKGRWPSFLRKTDQERAQNLGPIIKKEFEAGSLFERTVKLDGCLDGETLIMTEIGPMNIRELCEKQLNIKVLSKNVETGECEFQNITGFQCGEVSEDWYEICLNNGKKIIATGNHRFWVPEIRAYVEARNLSIHYELLSIL